MKGYMLAGLLLLTASLAGVQMRARVLFGISMMSSTSTCCCVIKQHMCAAAQLSALIYSCNSKT
jgi:hypothetical protein